MPALDLPFPETLPALGMQLQLLRAGQLDLALVQGGLADPVRDAALDSLGAVFFEPLWLFVRRDAGRALRDLVGRQVRRAA